MTNYCCCSYKALLLAAGLAIAQVSIAGELFIERVYEESSNTDLGNRVCNHWLAGSWVNNAFNISCIIGDCGEIMCDAPLDDISMILQGSRAGIYNGLSGDFDEMTSKMSDIESIYRIEILDVNEQIDSFHLNFVFDKTSLKGQFLRDEQILSATFTRIRK